jgi:hypothetical protein
MSDKDEYKKAFDAWESVTADYVEKWMKSPLMLGPMGLFLTQAMKAKGTHDKMMSAWWTMMGLPTKRDQERTLFALHKLESRLHDIEEKLAAAEQKRNGG